MSKFSLTIAIAIVLATFALTGCTTVLRSSSQVEITVSRGPCFGYCPVYEIRTIGLDHVRFEGIRHTTSPGVTIKQVNRAAVADVVAQLATYRPRSGSSHFGCANEISDQAVYTITWQNPQGTNVQSLTFDSGCQSPEGRALRSVLDGLPARLDFEMESRQVTRAGTPRG